jgi:hypothetical protein
MGPFLHAVRRAPCFRSVVKLSFAVVRARRAVEGVPFCDSRHPAMPIAYHCYIFKPCLCLVV